MFNHRPVIAATRQLVQLAAVAYCLCLGPRTPTLISPELDQPRTRSALRAAILTRLAEFAVEQMSASEREST
jgi:hypothetical protein